MPRVSTRTYDKLLRTAAQLVVAVPETPVPHEATPRKPLSPAQQQKQVSWEHRLVRYGQVMTLPQQG